MSTYLDMLDAVKNYYGSGSDQWLEIAKYGISADNAEAILSQVPGVQLIKNSNGSIRSYTYNSFSPISSDTSIAEELNSNLQSGTASIANNTKIKIPSNMGVNETGKLTLKSGIKSAGNFVFGEVVPAIAAAGVGISLGKTIDKTLYNLNPDFWDSHGMYSLNPDTWNTITSGDSSIGASLFNMVFGIDNGETQGYIDENAYAYLALWLQQQGFFAESGSDIIENVGNSGISFTANIKLPLEISNIKYGFLKTDGYRKQHSINTDSEKTLVINCTRGNGKYLTVIFASTTPFKYSYTVGTINPSVKDVDSIETTYLKKTFYYGYYSSNNYASGDVLESSMPYNIQEGYDKLDNNDVIKLAYLMLYASKSQNPIDGVSTQEGAVLPELNDITSVEDTLNYLKNKYPEFWQKAVEHDVVQPNGDITTYTYIPVPMPEGTSNIDIKPVSGDATQSNTAIKQDTSTQTLIDLITSIITTPPTNTDIPDTGSGDTPPVVMPSGSASALYSIYNPTQEELNNFGSWLWSANFVDQLLKMFNDPMQSIIGLHKVFAQPIISGRGNIKVGYLDSGINTNLVSNQYLTIDCGSVSIKEYFGNVFDYYPYTKIQLYLPFIGIVDLDTSDTMRSTLNIKYHIDVLTGACLAEVNITRDAHGGILYTYNGNCAVQYPLSSGSYMGIVTGIISAGIGVAVGVSGNPLLGAGITLSSINGMRTDIKHSGNLSGNAGAMGIKKPYIIITRPQTHVADEVEKFTGYPANNTVILHDLNGYVKVNYVHVEEIEGAFNSEKDEIERLLKEGVIIA